MEQPPPPRERSRCPYHSKPFRYTNTLGDHHYYRCPQGCDYELRYSIEPPDPTPTDEPTEQTKR
jgi:hypothetical protein